MNRQLLGLMRSILFERKQRTAWPNSLSLSKSTVSQRPSSRLGAIASMTAFTEFPRQDPVSVIHQPPERTQFSRVRNKDFMTPSSRTLMSCKLLGQQLSTSVRRRKEKKCSCEA